jgi:hypothetical protein
MLTLDPKIDAELENQLAFSEPEKGVARKSTPLVLSQM